MNDSTATTDKVRCFVSGKVQGVFFRDSTRDRALELGLDGSARNLPDGRVEVIARGDREALDTLRRWLREGPSSADVDDVDCRPYDGDVPDGFTTG